MPNHIHLIIFILKQSQSRGKGMMDYTLKYNAKLDEKGLINQTPTNDFIGTSCSTPNDVDSQNKKGDMPNDKGLLNIKNRVNCHLLH